MSIWSHYIIPKTLDEALQALAAAAGPVRPIAGGTDLLLDLQQGHLPPVDTLVDISQIPDLCALEVRGVRLFIGAAVPVSVITHSALIQEHARAISEACGLIGGPQVRNRATLGGNVAHALPAADGMIALSAMDAQAEIASQAGRRLEPILNLFRGPGVSALQLNREILVGFWIALRRQGQASAFGRVMRPQGVALPILNLAVWLQRSGNHIQDIRLIFGPSGPVPLRAEALEACFRGQELNSATLAQAKKQARHSLHFRSSLHRSGAEYRYELCKVLIEEVVGTAWKRAEG